MPLQSLPVDIKSMIWGYSLPDDVSEVCIGWPSYLEGNQRLQEPYLVDTAFPVLMHICRETREFVLSHPKPDSHVGPRFRFSKAAGCKVPYRDFRPDLDVFYLSNWQYDELLRMYEFDHDIFRRCAHLAVEMSVWSATAHWFNDLLLKHMQNIETVSIVFPGSENGQFHFDRDNFQPPGRRCRLKKIKEPESITGTAMMPASTRGRLSPRIASFSEWVEFRWEAAAERADVSWAHVYGEEIYHGSAWDRDSQSFAGVKQAAYTFEQFKRGEKGQEAWEEVCSERLHPTGYEPERVEMTRDPTEWRVNDDETWPPQRLQL